MYPEQNPKPERVCLKRRFFFGKFVKVFPGFVLKDKSEQTALAISCTDGRMSSTEGQLIFFTDFFFKKNEKHLPAVGFRTGRGITGITLCAKKLKKLKQFASSGFSVLGVWSGLSRITLCAK
jgi:hypothetical protein